MDRRVLLVLPALLLLLVVFVGPVLWLLSRAFTQPQFGFENFVLLYQHPVYLRVILNTLMISAIATPICALLGYPVAHAMVHASPAMRRLLLIVVLLPFWTSLLVRIFANMILLAGHGPLNEILEFTRLTSTPLSLLYNFTGMMFGSIQTLLPLMIFPLYAVMSRIEPDYMQAAMTLGSTPVRAFLRVYLPLTLPGVMTGSVLVFISALGYYAMPALLGGPRQVMISQLIQSEVAEFGNWGIAGALALIMLAATALMLGLLHRTVGLQGVAR